MYHGVNKGGGGVVGWNNAAGVSASLEEAFESTSGNEGIVCEDAEGPEGGSMVATASLDSESGALIWSRADSEAMARRTVAMSQMTSMLRDLDRNHVYEIAIKKCISHFMGKYERAPIALDIGTGSGLLAMLCAQHGAGHVFACEMYETMAQIAESNVANNGLAGTVSVIPAKSSDIDSLPVAPDIIVSELLDSALLGEAVILAHGDALSRLMSTAIDQGAPDDDIENRVVPNRATVYGTLIESEEIANMRTTSGITYAGMTPWRSPEAAGCAGGSPLVPLHWSQTEARGGRMLSSPHALSSFVFYLKDHPVKPSSVEIEVSAAGVVHGVLLWWETMLLSRELDPAEEIKYSTAPGAQNWQDHWVQVVHALPTPMECRVGDVLIVDVHHDNLHIWLNVTKKEPSTVVAKRKFAESFESNLSHDSLTNATNGDDEEVCEAANCMCGWHMLCGKEMCLPNLVLR
jgi:predicted RNA methylase